MQTLTFEQIDALLALIEFHDDWDEVSEIVGANVSLLYDVLTEMRDDAWILQLYWWRCNLPWVAGCHLHRYHCDFGVSFLLQFSPSEMKFQITEIEFDFDDYDDAYPGELDDNYKQKINNDTIGQIWDADDEDDLVEEITCATGWCIKSLDFRHVLS